MYEIENYLMGRTDLAVRVTAYGRAQRVADWIRYEIFKINERGPGKPVVKQALEFWISGNATGFSKEDGRYIRAILKKELPHPRLH